MDIYGAIYHRRSTRDFEPDPLGPRELAKVRMAVENRRRLDDSGASGITLVEEGQQLQKRLSGVIADYGKVEAPHYLIATSRESDLHLYDIGYSLEEVVLNLTDRGIGTCWIGKGFNDEELRKLVDLPENQTPRVLIAFGLPSGKDSFDRIDQPSRKDLDHFLIDEKADEFNERKSKLIDALRRAPSAINGQPWRVSFGQDKVELYIQPRSRLTRMLINKMMAMNKIDGGIGLCHLEVAAKRFCYKVKVQFSASRSRKGLIYVGSLSLG